VEHARRKEIAATFAAKGYAVVPAALSRTTVEAALRVLTAIESSLQDLPEDVVQRWFVLEPAVAAQTDPQASQQVFIVGDPSRFRPELASLITHPALVQLTALLLGTTTVCCHFSNLTTKQPNSTRTIRWHRDYPNQYMCPRRASFLRVMICLDGMDLANGPTQFVAGSHELDDEAIAAERHPISVDGADERIEVATCPPGSLVFIHPKVLHGGPANTSSRPRRNVIVQWGRDNDPVCVYEDVESMTGLRLAADGAPVG
jgi:ectoine hydroxylase-related dioxygenase (phytanoyl-CoA dioxygenase family)